MNYLKIDNYIINEPIPNILKLLKSQLNNGKLRDIQNQKGDNIRVTCPNHEHKNGREGKPSCDVYCGDSDDLEYGWFNCFTCHEAGPLWKFVAECFDESDQFGKDWLVENFGNIYTEENLFKSDISIINNNIDNNLDESILERFQKYHPYMTERKLSLDIIDRFKICYDPESKAIVFPVWDQYGKLKFLTRRSVENKKFIIDSGVDKPIYLLNEIEKQGITKVYVCESQINTLTLWSWGYPAIGLIGTGSRNQYMILNKTNIFVYYLCLDGDEAGDKGIQRFKDNITKESIIKVVKIPRGKDVNDLTKEQFKNLVID